MKKIFIFAAMLNLFAACNNNNAEKEAEIESATQAAIDSVNAIHERERLNDSISTASVESTISAPPAPTTGEGTGSTKPSRTPKTQKEKDNGTVSSTPPSQSEDKNNTPVSTAPTPEKPDNTATTTETPVAATDPEPEEKKKKGVNNTVKGAIIGAGAGAVGGAIINKENRGKGAIIGGVVGAGAGAVTGVILDKNKKKKQAAKDSAAKGTTTKEPDGKTTN